MVAEDDENTSLQQHIAGVVEPVDLFLQFQKSVA